MQEKTIIKLKLPTKTKVENPKIEIEATEVETQEEQTLSEPKVKIENSVQQKPTKEASEQSKKQQEECVLIFRQLNSMYPKCFVPNVKTPLAIGLFDQIVENELLKTERERLNIEMLPVFLKRYTKSEPYLRNLKEGAARINLEGEEIGVVDVHQQKYAEAELRWKQNNKQRFKKKKEEAKPVKKELKPKRKELQIGIRLPGVVQRYDPDKGYGFITADDGTGNTFVQETRVKKAGLEALTAGQKISYKIKKDKRRNQYYASKLKLIEDEPVSEENNSTKEVEK